MPISRSLLQHKINSLNNIYNNFDTTKKHYVDHKTPIIELLQILNDEDIQMFDDANLRDIRRKIIAVRHPIVNENLYSQYADLMDLTDAFLRQINISSGGRRRSYIKKTRKARKTKMGSKSRRRRTN